jgi:hypothetical protein
MIPLGYYFLFYSVVSFIIYRINFKRKELFKIFLLRKLSKLNKVFSNFDNKVKFDGVKLTSMQEKGIKIWIALLKDKSSILNSNILTYNRTIHRGTLLLCLKKNEGVLTLMDTNINLFYEIFIPQKHLEDIGSLFDKEQDKRMSLVESKKRTELENVLMKLIQ